MIHGKAEISSKLTIFLDDLYMNLPVNLNMKKIEPSVIYNVAIGT